MPEGAERSDGEDQLKEICPLFTQTDFQCYSNQSVSAAP